MQSARILTIANIAPRKRIDLCALTCAAMEKDFDIEWIVVGNGPEEERISSLAPGSMKMLDRMEWQGLQQHYNEADVFVLPSYDEGFGMVYIEAIMCGCPVVCRKGDGGEEIVNVTGGGVAAVLPEPDEVAVENIKEAIVQILNNRDNYCSEEIVAKARQMVDPSDIRKKWFGLLEKHGVC